MKTTFIIFTVCVIKSMSYQFPKVTSSKYYIPIVNFKGINQSIVYITNNNTDNILINSFLTELYSDHPVIVSNGKGLKNVENGLFTKAPNVIIFIDSLSRDNLRTLPFKGIIRSHWSAVYLITTTRSRNQTCVNGIFSKTFFENAQNYMNTMWHMYRVMRVTISFPYTCPHHYIIYSGKNSSHTELYDRTIKIIKAKNKKELEAAHLTNTKLLDLTNGYPLKATVFDRFPTSIVECDGINHYKEINYNYTNGYCGMDGLVMHDYIDYFKFNVSIPSDDRCGTYGFVTPETGNVTGVLGCIITKQVDVSFNSRFMVPYKNINMYHYLHYISDDALAVVLRRPSVIPMWHYAYNAYGPKTAIMLSILILVTGVMTWAWTWMTKEIYKQKPKKIYVYIVNAMLCTLFGVPIERGSERFRVLRATALISSVVFLAYYQGNVSKQFTTQTRNRELRTLQELYHSKYVLYTSPSIKELLMTYANPYDKVQVEYINRTKIKHGSVSTGYVVDHADAATLVRAEDVQIEVLLNFTDEQGSPKIYRIDESFQTFYLSYLSRPGFLFVEESSLFMMRLLEAGLPDKYYIWTRQTLKLGETFRKTETEPRPIRQTKLEHLRVAFGFLGFGYILSTCSFIMERLLGAIYYKRLRSRTLRRHVNIYQRGHVK